MQILDICPDCGKETHKLERQELVVMDDGRWMRRCGKCIETLTRNSNRLPASTTTGSMNNAR